MRLFRVEEYTDRRGAKALGMAISISQMAAYHDPQAGHYGHWFTRSWSSAPSNNYARAPRSAQDARRQVHDFIFPAEIMREARRESRKLTDAFEDVARLTVERDLLSGRLDRRKLKHIARHTAAGTYSDTLVKPYRRTTPSPAVRPHLAIIASAGNAEMWRDANYIPRVVTLCLALLWACETAGLTATIALLKGNCGIKAYRTGVAGVLLAGPDITVPTRDYVCALHRDLWRYGWMTAQAADMNAQNAMCQAMQAPGGPDSIGWRWLSENGGEGVTWARHFINADRVIAIGDIDDAQDADITLSSWFNVTGACDEIVKQAKNL